jgi:hypothetical protein
VQERRRAGSVSESQVLCMIFLMDETADGIEKLLEKVSGLREVSSVMMFCGGSGGMKNLSPQSACRRRQRIGRNEDAPAKCIEARPILRWA